MDLPKTKLDLLSLVERSSLESIIYGCSFIIAMTFTYVAYRIFNTSSPIKANLKVKPKKIKQKESKKTEIDSVNLPVKSKLAATEAKKAKQTTLKKHVVSPPQEPEHKEKVVKVERFLEFQKEDEIEFDEGEWMQFTGKKNELLTLKPKDMATLVESGVHKISKKVAPLPAVAKNIAPLPVIVQKQTQNIKPKEKLVTASKIQKPSKANKSETTRPVTEKVTAQKEAKVTDIVIPVREDKKLTKASPAKVDNVSTICEPALIPDGEWEMAPSSKKKKRPARKD